MSRRERDAKRATGRPRRPAREPAAPRRARAWWVGLAAALLALAVLALVMRRAGPPQAARPAGPASAIDRMDVKAAYLEGARLYQEHRHLEALPYFRRIGALLPNPPRQFHLQITDVLDHAALQTRSDAAQPASRSSAERVAMVREALAHLDAAERLSTTPRELAEVRAWRAIVLRVWGFPWEALYWLRSSAAADPTWTVMGQSADILVMRFQHPEVAMPGLDQEITPPISP